MWVYEYHVGKSPLTTLEGVERILRAGNYQFFVRDLDERTLEFGIFYHSLSLEDEKKIEKTKPSRQVLMARNGTVAGKRLERLAGFARAHGRVPS